MQSKTQAMVTKPYWPALMDACERGDHHWIVRTSNRLRLGGLGFALLAGAGLVALGPWVLALWAGDEIYTSVPETFCPVPAESLQRCV